jgi:hypothetical protein
MSREEAREECLRVLDTIVHHHEMRTLWPVLRYIAALEEEAEQAADPDPVLADIYKRLDRLSARVEGGEGLKRQAMEAEADTHNGGEP